MTSSSKTLSCVTDCLSERNSTGQMSISLLGVPTATSVFSLVFCVVQFFEVSLIKNYLTHDILVYVFNRTLTSLIPSVDSDSQVTIDFKSLLNVGTLLGATILFPTVHSLIRFE